MTTLAAIILFGLLMSFIALVGGLTLILPDNMWSNTILPLVAFAAGSLVGGAIFHMIPSAVKAMGNVTKLYVWLMSGFILFYALEEFLHFHHSHTHSHASARIGVFTSERNHQHPSNPTPLRVAKEKKEIIDTESSTPETKDDECPNFTWEIDGIEETSTGDNGGGWFVSDNNNTNCTACQQQPVRGPYSTEHLTWLIVIADGVHNFLGGMFVGASFLDSMELGISAWIAAAAHEIPQELGDFAILVHGGWSTQKALLFNFGSALTFPLGGIIAYAASDVIDVSFMVPFAAGNFLYIGASDLIPEVKHHHGTKRNLIHFASFVFGVGVLLAIRIKLTGWEA
mmetsp:Transcript_14104/g.22032  ORF Transcript_14104/g.22032 Transcript_14104/m.22032 type:complete len:341 (+) Transcript_14104:429-1451(+)